MRDVLDVIGAVFMVIASGTLVVVALWMFECYREQKSEARIKKLRALLRYTEEEAEIYARLAVLQPKITANKAFIDGARRSPPEVRRGLPQPPAH